MVTRGYDVTFISHDAVQELAIAANLKVWFADLLFVLVPAFFSERYPSPYTMVLILLFFIF